MDKPLTSDQSAYDAATAWIFDRINYERVRPRRSSRHFRLERVEALLKLIGSPQERIPAIHIAGTKGKGSTAAMLHSILKESGLKTGLFTSPHLHRFEERMQINGQMPDRTMLTSLVDELRERLQHADTQLINDGPTYFEVATLLAWMYFDRCQAECVVLETGLGGRLDCTNVCSPLMTIITCIGLDHMHVLGNTIEQIAAEKAGILKPGIPVATWPGSAAASSVISRRAAELACPIIAGGTDVTVSDRHSSKRSQIFTVTTPHQAHRQLELPLLGEHQSRNAALAVAAADRLSLADERITADTVRRGLQNTAWPMRFEVIEDNPAIILDAAHNPDSVNAFAATLTESPWGRCDRRVLIFGSSRDKDAAEMLRRLAPRFTHIVLTQFVTNPRAVTVDELMQMCPKSANPPTSATDPQAALAAARELVQQNGVICCTGSVFLAAEVRELLVPSV